MSLDQALQQLQPGCEVLWARLSDVRFSWFILPLGNDSLNLHVVAHQRVEGGLDQGLSCVGLKFLVVISNLDEQTVNDGVDMYSEFYFVLLRLELVEVLVDILDDGHEQVNCINVDLSDFVRTSSRYDCKHCHEDVLHLCLRDSAKVKSGQTSVQVNERFRSGLP